MAMNNQERQARWAEKKRQRGLTQMSLWVRPEHKEQIRAFAESLDAEDLVKEEAKSQIDGAWTSDPAKVINHD